MTSNFWVNWISFSFFLDWKFIINIIQRFSNNSILFFLIQVFCHRIQQIFKERHNFCSTNILWLIWLGWYCHSCLNSTHDRLDILTWNLWSCGCDDFGIDFLEVGFYYSHIFFIIFIFYDGRKNFFDSRLNNWILPFF